MKGSRPLTDAEVKQVADSFRGIYAKRNRALFILGVRTGFRVSELLSLQVGDVLQHGKVVDSVTVQRRHMKGGKTSTAKAKPTDHVDGCKCTKCEPKPRKPQANGRTVKLHTQARAALSVWLEVLATRQGGELAADTYVFKSHKDTNRPITRVQAWRILQAAYEANELTGKLGTHAMRKTFANRVYELLKYDMLKTQHAMGHANIQSTIAYLSFREEEITAAILAA
jgi:integrase